MGQATSRHKNRLGDQIGGGTAASRLVKNSTQDYDWNEFHLSIASMPGPYNEGNDD